MGDDQNHKKRNAAHYFAQEQVVFWYSKPMPDEELIDLDGLYPELSPEQLAEAEYNLTRYIDVVWRIYERTHGIKDPTGGIYSCSFEIAICDLKA